MVNRNGAHAMRINLKHEIETLIGRELTKLEHTRCRSCWLRGLVNPYDVMKVVWG